MTVRREDPLLVSARREAIVVFVIFATAAAYTVWYCGTHGYNRTAESLTFVFGFPDWVFYGIVLPWCLCVALSWAFGAIFVRDADLGQDPEGDVRE